MLSSGLDSNLFVKKLMTNPISYGNNFDFSDKKLRSYGNKEINWIFLKIRSQNQLGDNDDKQNFNQNKFKLNTFHDLLRDNDDFIIFHGLSS